MHPDKFSHTESPQSKPGPISDQFLTDSSWSGRRISFKLDESRLGSPGEYPDAMPKVPLFSFVATWGLIRLVSNNPMSGISEGLRGCMPHPVAAPLATQTRTHPAAWRLPGHSAAFLRGRCVL